MTNKLANENSPYLLQHAQNPVDWYPWGEEAKQKAKQENKPIFLSIGYAACHWCHVMAHESFENAEIAAFLNTNFVNIKVDREERPDIDGIYMQAVVALTGQGGWPLSAFLTPDGQPFYCGTYFPPVRKYNMPSFLEILVTIARLWKEDPTQLLETGNKVTEHLQQSNKINSITQPISSDLLNQACLNLGRTYDWQYGGWGKAPKFPQPMAIEFLLRRAAGGDSFAKEIALHALNEMSKGGMYDILGGGFSRYSTDNQWKIPHFEKMLYDNAQLATVYLHAWMLTKNSHYRKICEETLDFLLNELRHPGGGFFSSLDADTEAGEGEYYAWSLIELQKVVSDKEDLELFCDAYQISRHGSFEGKNILQLSEPVHELAQKHHLAVDVIEAKLTKVQNKLRSVRATRVRPRTDDKVLVSWNGLAMSAFAEAGRAFSRADYIQTARDNASFILSHLYNDEGLHRSWREGSSRHNAYLEDYAALILGLLSLYQVDFNHIWFERANALTEEMVSRFYDPDGGFFDTSHQHEALLVRPKDIQDNATPSGNALAVLALLTMNAFQENSAYQQIAEQAIQLVSKISVQHPGSFSQWLTAMDFWVGPITQIAILGKNDDPGVKILLKLAHETYRPRQIVAVSEFPPETGSPKIFSNRVKINQLPTAFVCSNFVCLRPTTSPVDFAAALNSVEKR